MVDSLVEQAPHNLAEQALGKAMLVAHHFALTHFGSDELQGQGIDHIEEELATSSKENCRKSSAAALAYLSREYMQGENPLFTHGCLIIAENDPKFPFVEKYATDRFSSYLLVRDAEGYWHAASPANYDADDTTTTMMVALKPSKELQEVIDQMQANDGGRWPRAKFVEYVLFKSGKYSHPYKEDLTYESGESYAHVYSMNIFSSPKGDYALVNDGTIQLSRKNMVSALTNAFIAKADKEKE